MTAPVFALVDCNNFYASCEKLFRPDLRTTPIVVLSNNDACVVARSAEAKALGIKMGVPVHHIKAEIRRYGIQVFSSNYTLYGDMSRRVTATLRKRFSVVLERTARELNGVPCLPWEDAPQPKKQIMCSRSFGQSLTTLPELEEAVAHFAVRASEKLRKGGQYATELLVFIRTNPFNPSVPQYSRSASIRLVSATHDARSLSQQALGLLRTLYREGFLYAKAGVMLSELVNEGAGQDDLFESDATDTSRDKSARLMAVMDAINHKTRASLHTAREAGPKAYAMRRGHLSPAYTTNWAELPKVN